MRFAQITSLVLSISCCFSIATMAETNQQTQGPVCSQNQAPYRDLDFLIGDWEFFMMDGTKIASQTYTLREQGCLILEDWKTLDGETGTGMNFVDPATGKWRQVWMSPRFHIDYSGGLNEKGEWVLEGRIYPNNGQPSSAVKGVYSKQKDGSVTKEFLIYDEKSKTWQRFFMGVARKSGK
jgi:hypothetical protein